MPFTPLVLEGLALELTAAAARGPATPRAQPWLERARELLHERGLPPPTATEIAARVGVHPSHLARAFRAQYGESVGDCARRLRLEWAAGRLARSDVALVSLATEAGFVDQSHFTRAFKQQFGLTPARYRRAHR
jgi:AraC family transcriptional regulator